MSVPAEMQPPDHSGTVVSFMDYREWSLCKAFKETPVVSWAFAGLSSSRGGCLTPVGGVAVATGIVCGSVTAWCPLISFKVVCVKL